MRLRRRKPKPRGGIGLHVFSFPSVAGWKPKTIKDALAIGQDMVLYGTAYATEDGRRVDPATVTVRNGIAIGGVIRLPSDGTV